MTATATTMAKSINSAIHGMIFGRIDGAALGAGQACSSIDDVHEMTQSFALAAPMGGGAILAMQALGGRPAPRRSRRD